MDLIFKIATGWLGWPPEQAWNTPMVEILMAWDSKRQFMIDTNPFDGGGDKDKPDRKAVAKEARMGFRVASMGRKKD